MIVATRPEPTVRTTLTDSECKTLLHSDRVDQLDGHLYVITRHAHLCTSRKVA